MSFSVTGGDDWARLQEAIEKSVIPRKEYVGLKDRGPCAYYGSLFATASKQQVEGFLTLRIMTQAKTLTNVSARLFGAVGNEISHVCQEVLCP